jgi:hypothetical protein
VAIVENRKNINSFSTLFKAVKEYDRVSILINRKVEILKEKDKENVDSNSFSNTHLRIVCYEDLIEHINSIESTHINYHYKNGLPKSVDKNAVISIFYPKEFMHKRLHFHEFEKLANKNNNWLKKSDYDITQYVKNAPAGFSLWMTLDEIKHVDNYKKSKSKPKIEAKEAKPRKEHNFCQLCNIFFSNYDEVDNINPAYFVKYSSQMCFE